MESQTKTSAKDFFINLGGVVALYTLVVSLLSLLFTVINTAYPQVSVYEFISSASISWPVATLVIFFPIFIFLMWLLEQDYKVFPEKQGSGIHKWITYITLFLAGLTLACDLITVLYYFLDGQELTTGFLLKVLAIFLVAGGVFSYYLYDALGKLNTKKRNTYRIIAAVVVLGSIVLGFAVLGSPATQRLYKYDEQKVVDLQNINSEIINFYATKGALPTTLEEVQATAYYIEVTDSQTKLPYKYEKMSTATYNLCAEFNKDSRVNSSEASSLTRPVGYVSWTHPAGEYCFEQTINPNLYTKPTPIR